MSKQRKIVNFSMMIAGAVFIFNPIISLFDFLPDFIGYILLSMSIAGLVDMLPYFDEARAGFIRLMWISLTKFPVMLLASSISSSSQDDKTIYLVFSFSYAAIELIFLFPAIKNYFSALSYLGERYGCISVSYVPTRMGKNTSANKARRPKSVNRLVNLTLVMLCVRSVMSVLPDFCLLYLYDSNGMQTQKTLAIYNFRPVAMFICAIIAAIFGVIWLVKFTQYIHAVKNDEALASLIEQKYDAEVAPMTGIRIYRTICTALTVLCVGVFCSADIVIDNINLLPDVAFGALLFAFAMITTRLCNTKRLAITAIIHTGIAALAGSLSYKFSTTYGYIMLGDPAADRAYLWVLLTSIAESVLAIIMTVFTVDILIQMIEQYTGHSERGFTNTRNIKKMKNSLANGAGVFGILGYINAIASSVYAAILSITEVVPADPEFVQGGEMVIPKYSFSGVLTLIFTIIWFVSAIVLANSLRNQAEEKYVFFGAKE